MAETYAGRAAAAGRTDRWTPSDRHQPDALRYGRGQRKNEHVIECQLTEQKLKANDDDDETLAMINVAVGASERYQRQFDDIQLIFGRCRVSTRHAFAMKI